MQDARRDRGKDDEGECCRLNPPKPLLLATNSHEAMLRSGPDGLASITRAGQPDSVFRPWP